MTHSFEERYELVTKAIELQVFKTLKYDIDHAQDEESQNCLRNVATKLQRTTGYDYNELYRFVLFIDNEEKVAYVPKQYLIDRIDENCGYDIVLEEINQILGG